MVIAIAERLSDLGNDVDAAHADRVVSLDPSADGERGATWGYAAFQVAAPVARRDGVAVVDGDALDGVPDPVRICVRTGRGKDPRGATLCVRRSALPLLVRVDRSTGTAVFLRRITPAPADGVATIRDDGVRTPDDAAEE